MQRCYATSARKFADYGGRGIKVCTRWHDVVAFVTDMASTYKPGQWLERKDNFGDYSPENCRWATPQEQNRNKRNNHHVSFNGREVTLAEFEDLTGYRLSKTGRPTLRIAVVSIPHPAIKADVSG